MKMIGSIGHQFYYAHKNSFYLSVRNLEDFLPVTFSELMEEIIRDLLHKTPANSMNYLCTDSSMIRLTPKEGLSYLWEEVNPDLESICDDVLEFPELVGRILNLLIVAAELEVQT